LQTRKYCSGEAAGGRTREEERKKVREKERETVAGRRCEWDEVFSD